MSLSIALVVDATTSTLVPQLTPEYLARVALALGVQLTRDVLPEWGGGPYAVRVAANAADLKPGEDAFAIVDTMPEAPGDVAYHWTTANALPVAFLALSACNSLDDVSTALSHENCETAADAACNRWVDAGTGTEYPLEVCDWVQAASYLVDLEDGQPPIPVSDFCLQAFFAPYAPGPYSFAKAATGPLVVAPGGYTMSRAVNAAVTQVSGQRASHLVQRPSWLPTASRQQRRGVVAPGP